MDNRQNPNKKERYIPMDEVRRPFPYEMREQRGAGMPNTDPSMREDDAWAAQEPHDLTKQQKPVRQVAPPPHRTVFSPGKHTITDFLTATNLLVLINVIVYVVVMRQKLPDDPNNILLILEHGGLYVPAVRDLGEYYRFFTAMFLHFDFRHLLNNMFCLFIMGNMLEEQLGKLRLLAVYLLGGLGGGFASYLNFLSKTSYPVSAGASGAVYALYGGFLAAIMFDKRMRGRMNPWQFAIFVVIAIGSQFSDSRIGNVAHFVGFLMGFVIAACIYLIDRLTKRGTYNNGTET